VIYTQLGHSHHDDSGLILPDLNKTLYKSKVVVLAQILTV